MMADSPEHVSDFMLNHLKREDMRPKENFKKLDLVRISGTHITGRIMAFDADHRLAHVDSTIGIGWWYLKDLELQPLAKAQKLQRKPFSNEFHLADELFPTMEVFNSLVGACYVQR